MEDLTPWPTIHSSEGYHGHWCWCSQQSVAQWCFFLPNMCWPSALPKSIGQGGGDHLIALCGRLVLLAGLFVSQGAHCRVKPAEQHVRSGMRWQVMAVARGLARQAPFRSVAITGVRTGIGTPCMPGAAMLHTFHVNGAGKAPVACTWAGHGLLPGP